MSVRENLIAARALIDTPQKWNRTGSFGHDGCWCAVGALEWTTGEFRNFHELPGEWKALWLALPDQHKTGSFATVSDVFIFNDDVATHADIMSLFDRAIQAQEDDHVG